MGALSGWRWTSLTWAVCGVCLLGGCGGRPADELFRLATETSADTTRYGEAETLFLELLDRYPKDQRCTRALFRLAQMDVERGRFQAAIGRYERVLSDYPGPDFGDKAQFMIGYTLAENLATYDLARVAFQKVIDGYPQSDLVDDAQWMIVNMGKSPEELGLFDGGPAQSADAPR